MPNLRRVSGQETIRALKRLRDSFRFDHAVVTLFSRGRPPKVLSDALCLCIVN
jgi:hypothetical protein